MTEPRWIPAVVQALAAWVDLQQGYVIDVEPPQLMMCLPNAGQALAVLHALMTEGDDFGFQLSAGLAQAIRSSDRIPRSPNDFTERTLQTVIELAGAAGPQQVAISPKLLSLLQLAVPDYAAWFDAGEPGQQQPPPQGRQLLLMRGARLPRYQGVIRVCRS